jgi:hypothetical protein
MTVLLATDGSGKQFWWCAITKRDTHSTLHLLSSINDVFCQSAKRLFQCNIAALGGTNGRSGRIAYCAA